MYRDGHIIVPPKPVCPLGVPGEQLEINEMPFWYTAGRIPAEAPDGDAIVEVYLTFDEGGAGRSDSCDEDELEVSSNSLVLETGKPEDTSMIAKAYRIAANTPAESNGYATVGLKEPMVKQMRLIALDRVKNCKGVIDGECWALGSCAVREILNSVVKNNPDTPPIEPIE